MLTELPALLFDFLPAKAIHRMVVDHPNRLHEGIADFGSHEGETSLLEVLAHGIGLLCRSRHVGNAPPCVPYLFAMYETPNVGVEGPKLVTDFKKFPGIANGRINFQPISDYVSQAQKFLDLALIVGVHDFWHKTVEGPLVPCTLAEDGCPAQASLSRFQDEKFEEQSVFMKGHTPGTGICMISIQIMVQDKNT